MKYFLSLLLVLAAISAMAAETVLVGVTDHQIMGYMPGVSSTTLPTYFLFAGKPIVEVSQAGVVLRYKKNGVWVTAP
jgi:hypothetical protein